MRRLPVGTGAHRRASGAHDSRRRAPRGNGVKRRRLLLPILVLAASALPAGTFAASTALPTPEPDRAVYDAARVWTADAVTEAESLLATLRADLGTQTAVVSLATGLATVTEAQAIGDASLIMRRWGVGNPGRDDGLVVLFDLDLTLVHGQIRIYPGYDLEAAGLPPDVADAIVQDEMRPAAADGDLDGALLGGLRAIDHALRGAAIPGTSTTPEPAANVPGGPAYPVEPGDPGIDTGRGLPIVTEPPADAGSTFGLFVGLFALIGAVGVVAAAATGGGRGGGGTTSAPAGASRHHGPWTDGGALGGGDGGTPGFGGGGDGGGSGGGGGSF